MYDIVIIGGGPAGLTAATYARRSGKSVLVIEKDGFGGQIAWSPRVENFPGFISISGAELGDKFLAQAMEQGADVELEEVIKIEGIPGKRLVKCVSGAEFEAKSVIIAAGAKPRTLGLPNEEKLIGNGVCFCAVCDGIFYKDKAVAVNGGGNSALQDALLLSEKCRKVYLIHRRDSFRGEAKLVEALKKRDNVEFILNTNIIGLSGDKELEALMLDTEGIKSELKVEGLFVAIGHKPDICSFSPLIELNPAGYANSSEACTTVSPDIFVAGDCRVKKVHQLTTAVADGASAALAACEYIDSL